MNFTDFNLNENLLKGIEEAGYTTCTPVQEQVLSCGLNGDDLYVQSQTGTGKTAAYLILLLQQLLSKSELTNKKALIMVPTRELAVQVEEEAKTLICATSLKSASFYGGVGYEKQIASLKKGIDILVGTPGRVLDLCDSGNMDLSEVAFLVVDEADRMFDMGFYPDLRKLLKLLPGVENRQTMLFSATLNTYVKNLAWEYTEEAKEITIEAEHITIDEIDQVLLHVSSDDKTKLLVGILKHENPASVIIFCNTKRSSEVIAKRLQINAIKAEYIIGDLPQSKRLQVLNDFKKGDLQCLVATDVAARGIDVDDLTMVINYDLPQDAENYVHRIGRTARAGKSGKAYAFCSEQDVYNLPAIERYVGYSIPSSMASDELFEEDLSSGMYIKTDRYDEDYDSNRSYGRHNSYGRSGSDKNARYGSHADERSSNRSNGRSGDRYTKSGDHYAKSGDHYAKANNRYDKSSRYDKSGSFSKDSSAYQDRRGNSYGKSQYNRSKEKAGFEKDLSLLSFEERMKIYKEKYASHDSDSRDTFRGDSRNNARHDNRTDNFDNRNDFRNDNFDNRNDFRNGKQSDFKKASSKSKNKNAKKQNNKKGKKTEQNARHPIAPKGTSLSNSTFDSKKSKGLNGTNANKKGAKKGSAGLLGFIQKFLNKKK